MGLDASNLSRRGRSLYAHLALTQTLPPISTQAEDALRLAEFTRNPPSCGTNSPDAADGQPSQGRENIKLPPHMPYLVAIEPSPASEYRGFAKDLAVQPRHPCLNHPLNGWQNSITRQQGTRKIDGPPASLCRFARITNGFIGCEIYPRPTSSLVCGHIEMRLLRRSAR